MSIDQTYIAKNGTKVIYRHKKRKYDFNHVIFVFSGFLNAKPGNYDFVNALNDCPCDVVWICDNFEEMYTYYLCVNMDFKVENAVIEFMQHMLNSLGLSISQSTTTGFSKGGSAALYYGLKYNIPNIVITVPQMHIGNYVHNNWHHVAKHMMGENYGVVNKHYLDRLLPKLMKQDRCLDKNIYLLTSEADIQYKSEIEPYLQDFAKYNNFNLLKTYSVFVREHNQVTSHHTALLLSIYYALASEAVPRFNQGKVNFFGSQPIPKLDSDIIEPYIDLRRIEYRNKILFIEGVGVLKGVHLQEYPDIDYKLILKDSMSEKTYIKNLAKTHKPHLTRELFDKDFVVYDKGWFTTYQYKGVNLSDIPNGEYQLYLQILTKGKESISPMRSEKLINKKEQNIHVESDEIKTVITLK